jgi:hypothetical protein
MAEALPAMRCWRPFFICYRKSRPNKKRIHDRASQALIPVRSVIY